MEIEKDAQWRMELLYTKNPRDFLSELCDLYGSDKGEIRESSHPYNWPSHTYADYYSRQFSHCRDSVKNVFECGIGTNNVKVASSMGVNGAPGASLRVWRDYFPNALIVGADIDREILFEEDRIKTLYVDQLNPESIADFWNLVNIDNFDFMIDDGLHTFEAGSTLFNHSISRLASNGIYVIEDVMYRDFVRYQSFFNTKEYIIDYVFLESPNVFRKNNNLIVIRRTS